MDSRAEIIRRAFIDKMGYGVEMFSSDELLTAAGISPAQARGFIEKVEHDIGRLAAELGRIGL